MQIVVGVDGSAGSQHALEWAITEARLRHADLAVVHAWSSFQLSNGVSALGVAPDLLQQAAEALLKDAVDGVDTTPLNVRRSVVSGQAAEAITSAAGPDDLIAVGSRGRVGFPGLLLGSVSQQVAHHAPCPVAVIHADHGAKARDAKIVVGVDGSDNSVDALRWAVAEADLHDAPVVAVHAWELPFVGELAGASAYQIDRETYEADSRDLIADVIARAGLAAGQTRVESLPLHGAPAQVLMSAARDAQLLVVGSRGRGGFARLLLGSVSDHCVHHAPTSTVLVPKRASARGAA